MLDDLYKIIGVSQTATQGEIREAYRALAKKHHPDLNPGDKAAEETFKNVQLAYDILSDEEKRRQYDAGEIDAHGNETARQYYREYADGGEHAYHSNAGFEDLGDIFADLFRGQRHAGPEDVHFRVRGGDQRYRMEVPFQDAVLGATKRLTLPDGQTLDVNIPAGHRDGQILRLKGKGMPGMGDGGAGDAYIEIHVLPHNTFRREGRDIVVDLPIALHEAVLGGRVRVPTVKGSVNMTVPAGSNTGDILRLKGRGVPATRRYPAGDQRVSLRVVLPEKPDEKLTAFLQDWAKDNGYDPRQGLES